MCDDASAAAAPRGQERPIVLQRPVRSLRRKLDRLVLLSVGIALAAAGLLNVWSEADRYLTAKRDTLLATARAVGAANSRGVAARDTASVLQGLRAIAQIPDLSRAEVQDREGVVLAELGDSIRLTGDLDIGDGGSGSLLGLLSGRTVRVAAPVRDGGEDVGTVVLIGDTADFAGRFWRGLAIAAGGSAAALALGLVLSHRLQRSITRPIESLSAAMEGVERTGRHAPVTGIDSDDEVGLLASRFNSMIGEIGRATEAILSREDEIIARLSRAAEQRDDQTGEHVVRVARISRIIARQLGLDPVWTEDFCRASPMHDVGKISIPDAILFKPGRLDPAERREMERHAEAGHRVLTGSSSKLVQLAAEIAISHHEKWDGTGYPRGLAGTDIPLSGRITAVADVCDALLSVRPYKQPWSLDAVRTHLVENAGSHFDPDIVAALVARWPELSAIYRAAEGVRPEHAEAA